MALNKYKLGELIEQYLEKNKDEKYTIESVRGISTQKMFISTKADMENVSLKNYKIVPPNHFAYVPDTSRRGNKISLAFNDTDDAYLVSSISIVFKVNQEKLLPEYLFMYFNRSEFDRYSRFNSWGSAREPFNYYDMCDIEIELPSIEIQKKYVNIYNAMVENQKIYEYGLEDLKRVADIYIENLPKETYKPIGDFIARNIKRNDKELFSKKDVKGFNNEGEFIKPMRLFSGDISTFKIIDTGDFVYNSRINSNIKKLSIAMNQGKGLIVSPAYESFYITDKDKLYPSYLYMLLQRDSFARKVLFNSYGSSTLVFGISDLKEIKIPLPNFETQKSIADIYMIYKNRWQINEQIKEQIRKLCPILIKGSLEEAQN